jgi:hypothetical protein
MEYAATCIWRHRPKGNIRQLRRDAFGPLPKLSAPLARTGDAYELFRFVFAQTLLGAVPRRRKRGPISAGSHRRARKGGSRLKQEKNSEGPASDLD